MARTIPFSLPLLPGKMQDSHLGGSGKCRVGAAWAAPIASLMLEKFLTRTVRRKEMEERIIDADIIHGTNLKYAGEKGIFNRIDWVLVILYLALVTIGWFNIYAAVYNDSHQQIFDLHQKYGKQMLFIIAALFLP